MKIFIDSADPKEIRELAQTGLVDGVTTNPSLAAKAGLDYIELLTEITSFLPGSVSAEVLATDTKGILNRGNAQARAYRCEGKAP